MIINGVEYVRADSVHNFDKVDGLQFVIVRTVAAGVHAGYLVERTERTVRLRDSRRLWRWHGRTLSGLSLEGTDDASKCKFGDVLPEIEIADWCEIIPCSREARESLYNVPRWEND